jgi:alpha-beta hydrolase superfamily lysophospholipase
MTAARSPLLRRLAKSALRIAAAVGAVYLLAVALVWWWQPHLIFFPDREWIADPKKAAGVDYQTVSLHTVDGVTLSAWFVPAENPRGTLLYCHGNGGNISNIAFEIGEWHARGFESLVFDYRGYGKSGGEALPTEAQTYLDGEAAWQWITAVHGTPAERLVIWGHSLGGGICAELAEAHRPAALVLQSTFTRLPDIGAQEYPWLPVRLLSRYRYPNVTRLALLECPVVIAHGPSDEIIPFEHGRRLFAAAREPKLFLELSGGHNMSLDESSWATLLGFLEKQGAISP